MDGPDFPARKDFIIPVLIIPQNAASDFCYFIIQATFENAPKNIADNISPVIDATYVEVDILLHKGNINKAATPITKYTASDCLKYSGTSQSASLSKKPII